MAFIQELNRRRSLGLKSLAVLVDPDGMDLDQLPNLIKLAEKNNVDFIFLGGSTGTYQQVEECIIRIKQATTTPIILFPGNTSQLHPMADAVLYLSLISGRNPEYLIGKHVESVPFLKENNLEIAPTGYILIDGGNRSSVSYISQTEPMPPEHIDIIVNTALAGQYLGMQLIYLEAGSGALSHVPKEIVQRVRAELDIPLIVGGGIRTPHISQTLCQAGADLIVIGNILEKDSNLLTDLTISVHANNRNINFN